MAYLCRCMHQRPITLPHAYICVDKTCIQLCKLICNNCKNLHQDHEDKCLTKAQFIQQLEIENREVRYEPQQYQQMEAQLIVQSQIIQNQVIQLKDWNSNVEQEENTTQVQYTHLKYDIPFSLNEEQVINLQNTSQNRKARGQLISQIKQQIKNVSISVASLGKVVSIKYGVYTENLKDNDNNFKIRGEYKSGIQVGKWSILNQYGEAIGGGCYNAAGSKDGLWREVEFSYNVNNLYYVRYIGQYKDGFRIGYWNIQDKDGENIGGGMYNQFGNKSGNWTDVKLSDNDIHYTYMANESEYNNGIKVEH